MNVKRLLISGTIFCSLASLVILSIANAGQNDSKPKLSEENSKTTTKVEIHSPKYSFKDLKKEAPVIVKGTVIDSKKTDRVDMNKNEDNDGDFDEIEFTDRVFRVQKVYKGTDVKPGDEIEVRTLEGIPDGISLNPDESQEYTLFLTPSKFPVEDGVFAIVGLQQGFFKIKKDKSISNPFFPMIKSLDDLEKEL